MGGRRIDARAFRYRGGGDGVALLNTGFRRDLFFAEVGPTVPHVLGSEFAILFFDGVDTQCLQVHCGLPRDPQLTTWHIGDIRGRVVASSLVQHADRPALFVLRRDRAALDLMRFTLM